MSIQLSDAVRLRLQEKKDRGYGLKAMATETGIPYSCLYEFLQGGGLRSDNLDKIVRYLGIWDEVRGEWRG